MEEKLRYALRKVKKRWLTFCIGFFACGVLVGIAFTGYERYSLTDESLKDLLGQANDFVAIVLEQQEAIDRMVPLLEGQADSIRKLNRRIAELERRIYPTIEELTGVILAMNSKVQLSLATEIAKSVRDWAKQYNLPPVLVIKLIERESQFNPKADSGTGAKGLMQIIPYWHQEKLEQFGIKEVDLYKINENVGVGCWVLREYLDRAGTMGGAMRKYVGSDHKGYIIDILSGFTDHRMKRMSLIRTGG